MERHDLSGFEVLVLAGAALLGALGATVWLGGWLAAAATGSSLHASFGDALAAASRLPRNLGDPRLAWQPAHRSALPGPVPYWASTGLVLLLAVFVAVI